MAFLLSLAIAGIPLLTSRMFNDAFTVIKWHAVHLIALGLLFTFRNTIQIPAFSLKNASWWIVGGTATSMYSLFALRGDAVFPALLDRISFIIYFFAFLQIKNKTWLFRANALAVILNTGYLICQIHGFDFLNLLFGSRPNSFFGNPNMLAQFLGLSLVIQLYAKGRYQHAFVGLILALIYYMGSRSALGASVLAIGVMGWQMKWERCKWGELLVSALLVGSLLTISTAPTATRKTAQETGAVAQQSSWEMRVALWKVSAKIFFANPFGAGNYEFQDVPHRVGTKLPNVELLTYNNPHNDFIRYLVEDGIIYVLCLVGLFIGLYAKTFWAGLPAWLFLGVEFMFQFPMLNAVSFVYIAFLLASLCTRRECQQRIPLPLNILLGILFVIGITANIRSSRLYAKNLVDPKGMGEACELSPGNWRYCTGYGVALREARYPLLAKHVFQRELAKRPYNYPALRQLALTEFLLEETYEGCYHTWVYDSLLQNKSSMHAVYDKYCKHMTTYFEREYDYKKSYY